MLHVWLCPNSDGLEVTIITDNVSLIKLNHECVCPQRQTPTSPKVQVLVSGRASRGFRIMFSSLEQAQNVKVTQSLTLMITTREAGTQKSLVWTPKDLMDCGHNTGLKSLRRSQEVLAENPK